MPSVPAAPRLGLARHPRRGGCGLPRERIAPKHRRWLGTAVLLGIVLAGCQAPGQVQITALDYRAIDPPAPRFSELPLEHCFWWTDDLGQVWVALEHEEPAPIGPDRFVVQLSLVLEKLPAGRERNYLVTKRELRGVARFGPLQSRLVSVAGIVALYRAENERLRGSFRLQVAKRSQQLLGWSETSRYLMLGTFTAVRDEERGRRIAEATESDGWDREPPAGSRPTTQPASVVPQKTR